jgi:hypothetical protein
MVRANVAPLEDEELIAAVQRAFRELIIPELERGGAEEFVISQVRSCLSILSYVGRGLHDRHVAREAADAELAGLVDGSGTPLPGREGEVRALLLRRLEAEIRTRTARR